MRQSRRSRRHGRRRLGVPPQAAASGPAAGPAQGCQRRSPGGTHVIRLRVGTTAPNSIRI